MRKSRNKLTLPTRTAINCGQSQNTQGQAPVLITKCPPPKIKMCKTTTASNKDSSSAFKSTESVRPKPQLARRVQVQRNPRELSIQPGFQVKASKSLEDKQKQFARKSPDPYVKSNRKESTIIRLPEIFPVRPFRLIPASSLESVSDMTGKISLVDQKKLQWAKEREELSGLWSPWGKPQEPGKASSIKGSQSDHILITSGYIRNLGLKTSQSECHLPPIGNVKYPGSSKHRPYGSNNPDVNENPWQTRKSSLPVCINIPNPNGQTQIIQHNSPYNLPKQFPINYYDNDTDSGHMSGYFTETNDYEEGNAVIGHQNNSYPRNMEYPAQRTKFSQENSINPNYASGDGQRRMVDGYNNANHFDASNFRSKSPYEDHGQFSNSNIYSNNDPNYIPRVENQLKNTNYQPPPAAMRSSFLVGADGPLMEAYGLELQKQEKENWLFELDQQREQDRVRKQMEKEEKRARWGDRGIGVGHFWEPSNSNSRLPNTPSSRDDNSLPPAWLERSLSNSAQNAKSESSLWPDDPNAYGDVSRNNQVQLSNNNANELRNVVGLGELEHTSGERTFLRGHNVPVDPNLFAEKEKKRLAALEHQEAIRRQIEDRQQRLKQEREKRIEEEYREERRIATQRLLEAQRLLEERNALIAKTEDNIQNQEIINTEDIQHSQVTLEERKSGHERQSRIDSFVQRPNQQFALKLDEDNNNCEIDKYGNGHNLIPNTQQPEVTINDCTVPSNIKSPVAQERSRSLSTIRDFATQTDMEERADKQTLTNRSQNSLNNKKTTETKKGKPRWGENLNKKQYVKQSEKDPVYQSRMKRQLDRVKRERSLPKTVTVVNNSETESRPPIKNKVRTKLNPSPGKRPVVKPTPEPRKALNEKLKPKNIPDNSSLFPEIEPKIKLLSAVAIELDGSVLPTSEEESGTRFSSPSLQSSAVGKDKDILSETSCNSSPEPFIPQRRQPSQPPKNIPLQRNVENKTLPKSLKLGSGKGQKHRREAKLSSDIMFDRDLSYNYTTNNKVGAANTTKYVNPNHQAYEGLRPTSPPVPAVLRKIRAGLYPEVEYPNDFLRDYDRLSRDPSPFREETVESVSVTRNVPVSRDRDNIPPDSTRSMKSNMSSSRQYEETIYNIMNGKDGYDVDLLITPIPSPRYPSNNLPTPRISSRPSTKGSDIAAREQLIFSLMNSDEVQSQLSGRQDELSERGIIEFSICVPPTQFGSSRCTTHNERQEDEYREEEIILDRKRATVNWLYTSQNTNSKDAVFSHLAYLKKEKHLREQEWGVSPSNIDSS